MESGVLPPADLLEDTPRFRIDQDACALALVFAFAGSTSGGLFSDALARARPPKTTWSRHAFASDLFVERFVRDCMQGQQAGEVRFASVDYVAQMLCAPPSDWQSVHLRRGITAELLSRPELRRNLGQLHLRLLRLQALIEGTGAGGKWDISQRQLEILTHFRDLLNSLESDFGACQSGLGRLSQFAGVVRASEAFASLVALLKYDDKLATLDFRLRLGSDGRIRELDLLEVEENESNPFHLSPVRRFLAKLELFARGFRFSEGELMARLLDAVFEGVRPAFPALVQLLGDVEFFQGCLRFVEFAEASGLAVCLPELVSPDQPRALRGLFNPLLLGANMRPVPCQVETDRMDTTLLITGPNSGGKTRLLQSLGLAQLLAQSGLVVPAAHARMGLANGLVVSLIQETHADQTEGRLGVELMRIRSLFEQLPVGAIVILDELCSGTNPSEGEEIFELVVRMLSRLRPQAFITTHFLEFASRLEQEGKIDELRFLQVVLGPNLEPTYQFAPGVATTSLASQAAARLGVTGEQLMALIDQKLAGC